MIQRRRNRKGLEGGEKKEGDGGFTDEPFPIHHRVYLRECGRNYIYRNKAVLAFDIGFYATFPLSLSPVVFHEQPSSPHASRMKSDIERSSQGVKKRFCLAKAFASPLSRNAQHTGGEGMHHGGRGSRSSSVDRSRSMVFDHWLSRNESLVDDKRGLDEKGEDGSGAIFVKPTIADTRIIVYSA